MTGTAALDQLEGAVPHLRQRMNVVVVAKAPVVERLVPFGDERECRHMRLLSSASNAYNRDYWGETAYGAPQPMLNVFHRHESVIRHVWGSALLYAPTDPGQDPRHVGTLEPLWNVFDLIPEGRGTEWEEQHVYPCCGSAPRR